MIFSMKVDAYSKIGRYHCKHNLLNQDYACSVNTEDFFALMLADGASCCKKSYEGARLACKAVKEIITKYGLKFFEFDKDKAAYLMIEHILYWIELNKEENEDLSEYGSTFSLFLLNKNNNKTMNINIGDSAILSIQEQKIEYIMKPKQYYGNPCLTTTEKANQYVDIQYGTFSYGDSIMVCSDGMLHSLHQTKEGQKDLMKGNMLQLKLALHDLNNFDDCTYISLMV